MHPLIPGYSVPKHEHIKAWCSQGGGGIQILHWGSIFPISGIWNPPPLHLPNIVCSSHVCSMFQKTYDIKAITLLYMEILPLLNPLKPLCTTTACRTCLATLARPFAWCKFIVHTFLVELKVTALATLGISKGARYTYPNGLTSRCVAFYHTLSLQYLEICDSNPTCTCVEL